MGANDHNAPGRPFAPPELRAKMGQNASLAQAMAARMVNAKFKLSMASAISPISRRRSSSTRPC
jgi:hypothetical protein